MISGQVFSVARSIARTTPITSELGEGDNLPLRWTSVNGILLNVVSPPPAFTSARGACGFQRQDCSSVQRANGGSTHMKTAVSCNSSDLIYVGPDLRNVPPDGCYLLLRNSNALPDISYDGLLSPAKVFQYGQILIQHGKDI